MKMIIIDKEGLPVGEGLQRILTCGIVNIALPARRLIVETLLDYKTI